MNLNNASKVSIAGIIVGAVILIIGIVIISTASDYHSTSLKSASFGGDFYTYAYDGIRGVDKTVNNMWTDLEEKISVGTGAIVSAAGLLLLFICAANLERYQQTAELIAALQKSQSDEGYRQDSGQSEM